MSCVCTHVAAADSVRQELEPPVRGGPYERVLVRRTVCHMLRGIRPSGRACRLSCLSSVVPIICCAVHHAMACRAHCAECAWTSAEAANSAASSLLHPRLTSIAVSHIHAKTPALQRAAETLPQCSTCFVLWLTQAVCLSRFACLRHLSSMLHMRDTENGCVFACTRACTLPPLDHTPIRQQCPAQLNSGLLVGVRQRRCPAPSPAHHCWF